MNVHLRPKEMNALLHTGILFEDRSLKPCKVVTGLEAVCLRLGLVRTGGHFPVLTSAAAYVPQDPEYGVHPEQYRPFPEELSDDFVGGLDPVVRHNRPRQSQYSASANKDQPRQLWEGLFSY